MKTIFGKNKYLLDVAAISLSAVCLLHCIALPALIALLPLWGMQFIENERIHVMLLCIALPISLMALWRGARCHQHRWFMVIGFAGLGLMVFGVNAYTETLEFTFTIIGVLLVVAAHMLNWRSLRIAANSLDSNI